MKRLWNVGICVGILALALLVSGCGGSSRRTTGNTSISGKVYVSSKTLAASAKRPFADPAGEVPFEGAVVTIYRINPDGSETRFGEVQAIAQADGSYALTGLPAPQPNEKFVIKATKEVNGQPITLEVHVPQLTAGTANTQNVDPVLHFAKELADMCIESMRVVWWTFDPNDLKSLSDMLASRISDYARDNGGLPDLTNPTEIEAFSTGLGTALEGDTELNQKLVDVVVKATPVVTITKNEVLATIAEDPAGDKLPEYNDGGDMRLVKMQIAGTTVKFEVTFEDQVVLSNTGLAIRMGTNLRAMFNDPTAPVSKEIWVYGTWTTPTVQLLEGETTIATAGMTREESGDGKTFTYTFDLADLDSSLADWTTWGISAYNSGDFVPQVQVLVN